VASAVTVAVAVVYNGVALGVVAVRDLVAGGRVDVLVGVDEATDVLVGVLVLVGVIKAPEGLTLIPDAWAVSGCDRDEGNEELLNGARRKDNINTHTRILRLDAIERPSHNLSTRSSSPA